MAYLIAATDFTNVSEHAVYYAAGLAAMHHLDLAFLHSFEFPAMVSDMPLPASLIDDTRQDAATKINALSDAVSAAYAGLKISHSVGYGSMVDAVERYSMDHGTPLLLILGNSNTTENASWFFSTLKTAALRLSQPVLAIPPEAALQAVQKICFAADTSQSFSAKVTSTLADIATLLGCEIHVLNVQQHGIPREEVPELPVGLLSGLSDRAAHYHVAYAADTDSAILQFCSENKVDMLAVLKGNYSFLENLLHKSHTKALSSTATIPLLILHDEPGI